MKEIDRIPQSSYARLALGILRSTKNQNKKPQNHEISWHLYNLSLNKPSISQFMIGQKSFARC